MDRILLPPRLLPNVEACYPTFLAHSDHKAVVLSLTPRLFSPPDKRSFCPTSFLQDGSLVCKLTEEIRSIQGNGTSWWEKAQTVIRREAIQFERSRDPQGFTLTEACLLTSTKDRVSPQGWDLLSSRGMAPSSEASAYSAICQLADTECRDRSGPKVLDKLKDTLEDPTERPVGSKKKDVWRLVKQLQFRRKLQRLRNTNGTTLTDPESIAKEITTYWGGIMNNGGADEPECSTYLRKFFGKRDLSAIFRALFKPMSTDLALKAPGALQPAASPGFDGFTIQVYKAFRQVFAPKLVEVMEEFLNSGKVLISWSIALLNPIPKVALTPEAKDLRPLVLQNTGLKWISACIALQLSDIIAAHPPRTERLHQS